MLRLLENYIFRREHKSDHILMNNIIIWLFCITCLSYTILRKKTTGCNKMKKKSYTCLVEIQNGINNKILEIYFP